MQKVDYLIIGQGLAGTLVAYFLKKFGKTIVCIDNHHSGAATKVAAGLINPITGRRYVKSWRIDELLPFALSTYQELEQVLDINIIQHTSVIRALFNVREENDWLARCLDPAYSQYIIPKAELEAYQSTIEKTHAYGEAQNALRINIRKLVEAYRQMLRHEGILLEDNFNYQALKVHPNLEYKTLSPNDVIFCDGEGMKQNPYFNFLPLKGDKGEALIVKIQGLRYNKSIKQRIFINPIDQDLYWIGATYEKNYVDNLPSQQGKEYLVGQLKELLKQPFEIIEHRSAIRPTVKDRRPLIGQHPNLSSLYLFNGLGTKGTSLGPFFANQFCNYLIGNQQLDPAVDLQRFVAQ